MASNKLDLVVIEWKDHWGRTDGGWKPLNEMDDPEPMVMKSVGWVVKETKECVLLSADMDPGSLDENPKSHSEQCILKSCIVNRKKLKN
jgi:hypothetical protein